MEIYPQNLGADLHIEIVRRRSAVTSGSTDASAALNQPPPKPELGMLGKAWARGTGMTDPQAAIGNPAAASATQGYAWTTITIGTVFAFIVGLVTRKATGDVGTGWLVGSLGMAGLVALGFGPMAKYALRHVHRALSKNEIETMMAQSPDELRKAYLQLLYDAVQVEVPEETAVKIREALEALGEALGGLPPIIFEPLDTAALHQQAGDLRRKASAESDRMTADSLVRQAESLEQRADSNAQSALVAKRTVALRDEIRAKIAALREAIAAQQSGVLDIPALVQLSESAQQVARDAQNTASAQDELSRYLTDTDAQTAVQKVGG